MAIKSLVSLVVIGTFLMFASVTPSTAIAPVWSYEIENMTGFAMSKNGEYLIVACEKGPSCEKGQFYVFNQYGNIVKDGCIESEITVMDIAGDGTFFVGAHNRYCFSSISEEIQVNTEMEGMFESVSLSENGEVVIAGTDKEILIFDRQGVKDQKDVGRAVTFTAVSASGSTAVAGTNDALFLCKESSNTWEELPADGEVTALAVSGGGSSIAYSIATSMIILDSQLNKQGAFEIGGYVTSIAMTSDGIYLVCGTQEGGIFYLDSSGEQIWNYSVEESVQEVAISFEGELVAVLNQNITLFNSLGNRLQEIESSEPIRHMQLSEFGEILSYSPPEELIFSELYQRGYALTYEYMLPSKKSTLLQDYLSIEWSYNGASPQAVIAADINKDKQKEIICSYSKEIIAFDLKGNIIWKKQFPFEFGIAAMDLTFDFIPEVIVTSKDNHMRFHVLDGNGKELASHNFYSRWHSELPSEEYPIRIRALWSGDIDNDGFIEVVCRVSATYLLEPRGIYVFEYPSFKEEWFYPSAPNVETVNIVDLDNDGNLEIVCGSNATCNGQRVRNTDDCHAYVSAINLQGEELWVKEIGSGYKRVYIAVADFDGNGTNEVVCGGWSLKENWGELFVLDAQGNHVDGIDKVSLGYPVFLKGVSDLDSDGDTEVLVSDEEKALAVYDHNLHLVRKSNVGVSAHSIVTVNDLDGDGQKEIVAISHDDSIVILDSKLEEEWSASFSGHSLKTVVVVNLSRCKNDLLILADKLYLYSYKDQSLQPCVLPLVSVEMEVEKHIDNAKKYFNDKNYLRAIEEYDLAIEKLKQTNDTEKLAEVTTLRTKAYEHYNSKLLEADQLLEEGKMFMESEDFLKAGETLLTAREIYNSLDKLDEVQKIDELLPDIAIKLFKEGIYFLELEDFLKAGETFSKAREIHSSLGKLDEVQKIDEILSLIEQPLQAQEFIAQASEKESEGTYREAIQYYEEALHIYEELGEKEKIEEVQTMLEEAKATYRSTVIIKIAFVIAFVVVSLSYFRKRYRDEDKRTNITFYLVTIVALVGVFMISLSSVSLLLGNVAYIVTISICIFILMILSAYLRRS